MWLYFSMPMMRFKHLRRLRHGRQRNARLRCSGLIEAEPLTLEPEANIYEPPIVRP
jgi:hypothetical protein